MLDSRSKQLLQVLNTECEGSTYKVFDKEFLISSMPKAVGLDEFGLKHCLNFLLEREYISIKYEDEKELCVCPLPKGRLLFEENLDSEIEVFNNKKSLLLYSFFGAFIGSFFVSLLITLVLALVGKL